MGRLLEGGEEHVNRGQLPFWWTSEDETPQPGLQESISPPPTTTWKDPFQKKAKGPEELRSGILIYKLKCSWQPQWPSPRQFLQWPRSGEWTSRVGRRRWQATLGWSPTTGTRSEPQFPPFQNERAHTYLRGLSWRLCQIRYLRPPGPASGTEQASHMW